MLLAHAFSTGMHARLLELRIRSALCSEAGKTSESKQWRRRLRNSDTHSRAQVCSREGVYHPAGCHDGHSSFAMCGFRRWLLSSLVNRFASMHEICTLPAVRAEYNADNHFFMRNFNRGVRERRSCSGRSFSGRKISLGGRRSILDTLPYDLIT